MQVFLVACSTEGASIGRFGWECFKWMIIGRLCVNCQYGLHVTQKLRVNRMFDLCNLKSVLQFTANLKANLVAWVSSIYLWSRFRFKHWPEAYPQLRTVISYVGLISVLDLLCAIIVIVIFT